VVGPGPDQSYRHYLLPGSVDLFVYPTRKFKTTLVSVLLHRALDEGSSAAALVPYVLRRGTRTHPDMVSISRALEWLFGAGLDVDVLRFGERQILSLRLDVVDDRYLLMGGRDLLRRGMELLRDVLVSPPLSDGTFDRDVFEQERLNLRRFLEGIENDKGRLALDHCIRKMCEGEAYARYEYGEIEEVDALTPEEVTARWREILATTPLEIYVVGSAEPESVLEIATGLFDGIRDGASLVKPPGAERRAPGRVRRLCESGDLVQDRLVMGYRSEVSYDHPLSFPLAVMNTIFGGGSFSRLFREVREKRSLAYYCSSSMDQAKGVGFVQAGVESGKTGRVERIVRRQLTEMRQGRVELDELKAAKAYILNGLRSVTDSPARIAGFLQERQAGGAEVTFAEVMEGIRRVRRRDVAAAAGTLKLDTVYTLSNGKS